MPWDTVLFQVPVLGQNRESGLWRSGKKYKVMAGHHKQSAQSRATVVSILGCNFGERMPEPKPKLTPAELIRRNQDDNFRAQDAHWLEQMRQTARVFGDFGRVPRLGR